MFESEVPYLSIIGEGADLRIPWPSLMVIDHTKKAAFINIEHDTCEYIFFR